MRIGFTRNGAVNTVMTSKIGSEQKPKYLERNPLLLKQRYGRQEQGGGSAREANKNDAELRESRLVQEAKEILEKEPNSRGIYSMR